MNENHLVQSKALQAFKDLDKELGIYSKCFGKPQVDTEQGNEKICFTFYKTPSTCPRKVAWKRAS